MRRDGLRQDLRFAWRGLCRAKAFSGAAVLTLALGIAGTTLVLTLIQGVLLRPLPVRDQDREIAARVALGATSAGVRRLALGEGLWLAGIGSAVGLALAVRTRRVVSGILFDIDALEPSTLAGAALLLIRIAAGVVRPAAPSHASRHGGDAAHRLIREWPCQEPRFWIFSRQGSCTTNDNCAATKGSEGSSVKRSPSVFPNG